MTATFSLREASFSVPGRTLLHPMTLDLIGGRVIGLVGHNGSGKSTLLKCLARQQTPSGGSISYDGRPLARWNERAFARTVAYLPQHTPLAPGMLVRELVALGRYPWHGALGRVTAQDRARIDLALDLTDTARYADRFVETLSGGERQRVWLAMLVAQDARCLLLDEPISALDVAHQIEVLSLVRGLCDDHGVGAVVVLHEINMAARFCDEIVALKDGRLVCRGAPAAIMDAARLEAIYGIAMDVLTPASSRTPLAFAR